MTRRYLIRHEGTAYWLVANYESVEDDLPVTFHLERYYADTGEVTL